MGPAYSACPPWRANAFGVGFIDWLGLQNYGRGAGVGRGRGVRRGLGVGVAVGVVGGFSSKKKVQLKSTSGPQSKAPAEIWIVLNSTVGVRLKMKSIVVLPFDTTAESAGIPLTVRSLA